MLEWRIFGRSNDWKRHKDFSIVGMYSIVNVDAEYSSMSKKRPFLLVLRFFDIIRLRNVVFVTDLPMSDISLCSQRCEDLVFITHIIINLFITAYL